MLEKAFLAVVPVAIYKVASNKKLILILGTFPLWAVSKEITKSVNRDITLLPVHRRWPVKIRSRLVFRYSNTCSTAYIQTIVYSGNEPDESEPQETEWLTESVTVIRQEVSVTAEISAQRCYKKGKETLLYTINVFALRICNKLPLR